MEKKAILIVEDEKAVSNLYMGLLKPYNCHLDFVTNLKDAFDKMESHGEPYDVYIVDIDLGNGEEGLDIIGKAGNIPDRTLVLSGNLPEEIVEELMHKYRVPRHLIMVKPPDSDGFVEIIEDLLLDRKEILKEKEEIVVPVKEKNGDWKPIRNFIDKFTGIEWLIIMLFLLFLPTALTTWATVKGYRIAKSREIDLYTYCENRFENYRLGEVISNQHYTQSKITVNKHEVIVRIYPEGFINLVLYVDGLEPRDVWIPSPGYIDKHKLDEEATFLSILAETWLKVK